MRKILILLMLYCVVNMAATDGDETRDLPADIEEGEDLERRHRKRKKHGQQAGPCGYGGYGKSFGSHDTYVSAPVMNYFFGCGVAPVPVAPISPIYPQYAPVQPIGYPGGYGNYGGHGHGGHGQGGHGHGGHGHGVHGHGGNDGGFYGGQGVPQYQQLGYNQGYSGQYNRPFQNAVSAAASGFGSVLADYITRPRKTQKQINQFLRPIYRLF